ncbi:MAG: Rieske 2Fe-2S domain-containing protein [Pirellulales bacterium]
MAEKKKMSVAEILAAARAEKQSEGRAEEKSVQASEAVSKSSEETKAAVSVEKKAVPKSGSGRPSVSEILAMARQKGKSETTEVAAPKPKVAASKASPQKAKPSVAAGKKGVQRDTASILAAARAGTKPGPVSKAEAPARAVKPKPVREKSAKPARVVPPMPERPRPAIKPAVEERRTFFSYAFGSFMAAGFTALSVTGGLFSLGLARFMFPNVLAEPPSRFKVGSKDGFPAGKVETKFVAQYGVWVVNSEFQGEQQIYALKTVCTHLGCTPNWLEAEQKFKCPCHGSGFYKDGINFEGPAPRPLERYAIRIADDGQLEVDKSRAFQEELGQWADPASYVNA